MNLKISSEKVYSFLWALVLITPAYMVFFESYFGLQRELSLAIIAGVILCCSVLVVSYTHKVEVNRVILVAIIILSIHYLSSLYLEQINYSFVQFGFYVIIPAFLVCQKVNFERIFYYLILLSIVFVVGLNKMLIVTNIGLNQADMYVTYSFVPCILASFVHFFHYRRKKNLLLKIGYILNLIYLLKVGITAVRGFWFTILFYIISEIIFYFKKKVNRKTFIIVLYFAIALILYVGVNLSQVLKTIFLLFKNVANIEIGFLLKTARLIELGDLTNGRIGIWRMAMECFFEKPWLGWGIGGFSRWTNGRIAYPHNVFLQFLTDGGIIIGLGFSLIIIIGLCKIYFNMKKNNLIPIAVFITAISIPMGLLSMDIWKTSTIWFAIFFYIKYIFRNEEVKNE